MTVGINQAHQIEELERTGALKRETRRREKLPNDYYLLHRSRHHNHIALKDGKIYIYDNSGSNPDETDDGPLVVADGIGCIRVEAAYTRGDYTSPFGPQAQIPVKKEGERYPCYCHVDLEGAIKLGRRLSVPVDLVTNLYRPPV